MQKMWIDTDTASDDAVAILMALRWPGVQVEGISVVSGNVPVEMGVRNALYTVDLCGKDTPVYPGLERPLMKDPSYAYFFHGEDGMGNMNYPAPRINAQSEHAVEAFVRRVREMPGELTLVTLGPLSNIAAALHIAPDISGKIARCYIMGGAAACLGNITPAAEFNIWVDPEAANIVFQSGIPILMVGWEHCRGEANLSDKDMDYIRSLNNPYADFTLDCNLSAIKANREWLGDPGLALPDPVTMAIALDPTICIKYDRHYVEVETKSELTRGMTVVDELGVMNKAANIDVCWKIDIPRWKETLYATLRDDPD